MKFNQNILLRYISLAPLALAFERYLECRIFQCLPFQSPVLDIGCGDGVFAHVLFSDRIETGVDPNGKELMRARELNAYSELIRCPGHAVPKSDGFYNTIFSNSVLEHIPDLVPVFNEIHRLLAPGGLFYMTVPSTKFEEYTLLNQLLIALRFTDLASKYRQFCSKNIWRQFHYYTLEGWIKFVSDRGFVVVDSFTYDPKAICLLNDFLYPFGVIELLYKQMINRWTLAPSLRKVILYPIYLIARKILEGGEKDNNGGLIFLAMKRKDS